MRKLIAGLLAAAVGCGGLPVEDEVIFAPPSKLTGRKCGGMVEVVCDAEQAAACPFGADGCGAYTDGTYSCCDP